MIDDERKFLGLGTNLGDKYLNITQCKDAINFHPHIWIINQSNIYQSAPLYNSKQEDYYNMVVEIETNLNSLELLTEIKKIEIKLGREINEKKNMPRIIDIDILALGSMLIQTSLLTIPHVSINERKFVLKPWNDIAPNFNLPKFNKNIGTLLKETSDDSDCRLILEVDGDV